LSPYDEQVLVRAFSAYFGLVNLAEQQHRVRRRRANASEVPPRPQPLSLVATVRELAAQGVDAATIAAMLGTMRVDLVLTAHPTEATRASILTKHRAIADLLERLERERLAPDERQALIDDLYRHILLLWRTDEARSRAIDVLGEVKGALYYVDTILLDALPAVHQALEDELRRCYPDHPWRVPPLLRLGSWIGGDADGNPHVTGEVLTETLRLQQALALARYRDEVRALATLFSQSERLYAVPTRWRAPSPPTRRPCPTTPPRWATPIGTSRSDASSLSCGKSSRSRSTACAARRGRPRPTTPRPTGARKVCWPTCVSSPPPWPRRPTTRCCAARWAR